MALSPDGRFAFVTLQGSGTLAVFNLAAALASGLRDSGFVGAVRLGVNPIGITSVAGTASGCTRPPRSGTGRSEQGTLSVINVPPGRDGSGRVGPEHGRWRAATPAG